MNKPFEKTEEFSSLFDTIESEYYDPIDFKDSKVGFSIKRNYPDNIRYKPAAKKDKKPDNVVTIWVGYTHTQETSKNIDLNKVPLWICVANFSLYRTNHLDYDFNDSNCPTEVSLEQSRLTPKPIELEYNNEFFYNHGSNVFINESGNIITGIDILNRAYSDHCDTVHRLKGLKLRLKLSAQSKVSGLLSLTIYFLRYILKTAFGRTLEVEEDNFSAHFYGYNKSSLKKLNEDSLNVFGYKAAKPVIIVFCSAIIIICLIIHTFNISCGYLARIVSSNVLSISHGILLLWLLDAVMPNLIFFLINTIIKFRTALISRKLKF